MKVEHALRMMLRDRAKTNGSQIVELAIALPLLMVIVVGIMDFGTAFKLKQVLNGAAREGGRFASNQTMADVSEPNPNSVAGIRDAIDTYLAAANVKDCGLATAVPNQSGMTWTYTASSACAGNGTFTLIIDRGNALQTAGTPPLTMETTKIHISYPYQWLFGNVMRLIIPTANYATGVTSITSDVIMTNLN